VSVVWRHFVAPIGSPAFDRFLTVREQRLSAAATIKAFMAEIGASNVVGTSPATYRVDFNKEPDRNVWSKTKPVRGTYYFKPRKNTPGGKEIADRIKALPECPSWDSIIESIPDLPVGYPLVFEGSHCYFAGVMYASEKSGLLIVRVPWREGDGGGFEDDHANWMPPDWLREVKEWEALKLIDDAKPA
jgi:hypothetical protein